MKTILTALLLTLATATTALSSEPATPPKQESGSTHPAVVVSTDLWGPAMRTFCEEELGRYDARTGECSRPAATPLPAKNVRYPSDPCGLDPCTK